MQRAPMNKKRIICWIITIVMLGLSFLSPILVSATTMSDAKEKNRYGNAVDVMELVAFVDACVKKIGDSPKAAYAGDNENREEQLGYYYLNFAAGGYYTKDKILYYGTEQRKCSDLKNIILPNDEPVIALLKAYDLYTMEELPELVCGEGNSNSGLFKIRTGYYCGGWGCDEWGPNAKSANGHWPENWPIPDNDGYPKNNSDCRATFENIHTMNQDKTLEISTHNHTTTKFVSQFQINQNFSFAEYLKDYTGTLDSTIPGVKNEFKYRILKSEYGCKAQLTDLETYNTAKKVGADGAGYYEIFHNGAIEYWKINNVNTNVYTDPKLTASDQVTCGQLAAALAPDSTDSKQIIFDDRYAEVKKCYNTYTENLSVLKEKLILLEGIKKDANNLSSWADKTKVGNYAAMLDISTNKLATSIENKAREISNDGSIPGALTDIVNEAKKLEQLAQEGTSKEPEISQSQKRLDDLISKYDTQVIDKVKAEIANIPELKLTDALAGNSRSGVTKNEVADFYKFEDDGSLTCYAANQTLEGPAKKISDILGVKIELDEYQQIEREEDPVISQDDNQVTTDQCYKSAGSLGWFICPVMNTAAKAMLRMYDSIEQDFLIVESDLTKDTSATRNAWSIFVNFANVAMVILLLIVIISQITGFGIDNYGIKKLLPKIITVALLVNLSFIICQLAVDVSNIVGKSAKDLLTNTAATLTPAPSCRATGVDCHNPAGWFNALILIAGGGVIGLGGIEIAQGIITGGMLDGLIIPILILVLVAVIAIIFFFVLLGLRKAAVVILIVISPLAFICYALPNTKKLFTKWFDAMKGMLLLYPLCGIIIGGGTLASKIILSASQDYVTYFIGAIMMVVPFFMVPSLLKSSFQALGGIGAKISGLGKSLRTKTQGRANKVHQNTAGYKARQGAHQAEFANRVKFRQAEIGKRRADRAIKRLENRKTRLEGKANGKNLSQRQQDRLDAKLDATSARLYDATNTANQYENTRADYRVGIPKIDKGIAMSRAESRLQAQETKLWSEQLAKADTNTITTAFEDSLKTGNVAKMSAAFEALKNTGNLPKIHDALKNANWDNMSSGMRLALNQSMIGSGDVAMKAYAKESFKNNNKGSFKNFMEGVDTDGLGTVQGALQKLGSHALDGQNKDTVEFIANHTGSLGNGDWVAKMIMSGLTSTQNGEEKAKFKDMLKNYKAQSSSDAEFAENIKKAINASTLAKMDSGSFDALNELLGGKSAKGDNPGDYSAINSVLGDTIRELQQANNATLYASLSNDIKSKLSAQPQPQEIQAPHTPQSTQAPHTPQSTQGSNQTPIEVETNFSGDGSGIDG